MIMLKYSVAVIEDEKLEEKRNEFFQLYKKTFGLDPLPKKEKDSETNNKKVKFSINIFGVKADI